MRISSIEAIPIRVPRIKPMISGLSVEAITHSEFGIVVVEVDDGIKGLGEISITSPRIGSSLCHDVNHIVAPALEGKNPFNIARCLSVVENVLWGFSAEFTKAAIDMALFDIVGKALEVPVYQLLGGKVRRGVPVNKVVRMVDPQQQADEALQQVEEGYRTVKLKVGRTGNTDVEAVRLVREAVGPSINIKVDANGAWPTPKTALRLIKEMEEFDLQMVEQPIAGWNLEGMAYIRARISTPLLADESVYTFRDALRVAKCSAADVLNVYVSEAGGLLGASKVFTVAEAAGLPCLIGSQCELGIGTAAGAHLGVAMPNLAFESDLVGVLRYPEDVVNEQIEIENGVLYPPEGVGLGVSLDWDRVKKWRMD